MEVVANVTKREGGQVEEERSSESVGTADVLEFDVRIGGAKAYPKRRPRIKESREADDDTG